MKDAIGDVKAERERQKAEEGWTPEHDDKHMSGELAKAAASYALSGAGCAPIGWPNGQGVAHFLWPWDKSGWKPTTCRRDLVKAAALLVAEIERIDRAEAPMTRTEAFELNSAMIDGVQALLLSGNEAAADNLDRRRMSFNVKAGLTETREATTQPGSERTRLKVAATANT